MKIRYLASVAVVAAVSSTPVFAQTKTITVDGSSTVFPVCEAIAEEFQKAKKGRSG